WRTLSRRPPPARRSAGWSPRMTSPALSFSSRPTSRPGSPGRSCPSMPVFAERSGEDHVAILFAPWEERSRPGTLDSMASKPSPLLCELHSHTTWSDGELTVRELCDLYGRSGFDVLAVTDHTTR